MSIKPYRNWSIHWKIMLIPIITLILILAGTELVVLPRISSWLMEQEMHKVRNVVEVAYQQIVEGARASADGHISLEEAQKDVKSSIKQMRYGKNEYFWINDLTPRMIMHPTKPELDGSDVSGYKDPNGKLLFMAFVKTCKEHGEGFVDYMWPKPGEDLPVMKTSYVKLYKPWGWIIGSGLYVDTFKAKVQMLHQILLGTGVIFSCAMLVLAWTIGRGIKRSVDEGQKFAAAVSSGDLTRTLVVINDDEVGGLGKALNTMVANLRSMIGLINTTSGELAATALDISQASGTMVISVEQQQADILDTSNSSMEITRLIENVNGEVKGLNSAVDESSASVLELAVSIAEVAQNMEHLTSSVDDIGFSIDEMSKALRQIDSGVQTLQFTASSTASSVTEFNTSIREIENSAKESALISDQVRNDAKTGRDAVEATIDGISKIIQSSQITAESIGALSDKAKSIDSIVTVIDDIAHQTSLLALNASIIAAQSGQHGRSFGVVAVEIKQLAERTTRSTREIADVIKGVKSETTRAVNSIGAATESIKNGEQLSRQAGAILEKIVIGVNRSAQQMSEIARATKEQTRGSEMISLAMEQISEMSTAIADNTDQQRKGSEAIQEEADKVRLFSAQVMKSMKEQTNIGNQLRSMVQQVSEMSEQIKQAGMEQTNGSKQIEKSVERIQQSAAAVHQGTKVLDSGVAKLGNQAEMLYHKISSFKV